MPPPVIDASSPPAHIRNQAGYSHTFTATGGTPPFSWSIIAGALPTGLSLGISSGAVTGTPTVAGTFNFTVHVRDNIGQTDSDPFSITIHAEPVVITTTLPNGTVATPYSQTLAASDGVPPYTWALAVGSLPAGLALSSGGVISGTPTAAGASAFTVRVTESLLGVTDDQALTLTIEGEAGPDYTAEIMGYGGGTPSTFEGFPIIPILKESSPGQPHWGSYLPLPPGKPGAPPPGDGADFRKWAGDQIQDLHSWGTNLVQQLEQGGVGSSSVGKAAIRGRHIRSGEIAWRHMSHQFLGELRYKVTADHIYSPRWEMEHDSATDIWTEDFVMYDLTAACAVGRVKGRKAKVGHFTDVQKLQIAPYLFLTEPWYDTDGALNVDIKVYRIELVSLMERLNNDVGGSNRMARPEEGEDVV